MTINDQCIAFLAERGITYSATFVPQNQSRNNREKARSLNWRISIGPISTDYTQGIGHMPNYQPNHPRTLDDEEREIIASEKGKYATQRHTLFHQLKLPAPSLADVLYSLVLDCSVLESSCFEDWAAECGFDPDSRKGEATYRACLEIALKMRRLFGEAGLATFRELFTDY